MNLSDLHKKLSRDARYRAAYDQLGDSVSLGLRFRAAREKARLTRTQLSAELGLHTRHIATVEDDFDFSDAPAVSLIADRLEAHLQSEGVDPARFILEGARLTDVPPAKAMLARVRSSGHGGSLGSSRSNPEAVLRRRFIGELSDSEAVRDLVNLGVRQPRAELLISMLEDDTLDHS